MIFLLQEVQGEGEEGDALHQQPDLLRHLPASHQLQSKLCDDSTRSKDVHGMFVGCFEGNFKTLAKTFPTSDALIRSTESHFK